MKYKRAAIALIIVAVAMVGAYLYRFRPPAMYTMLLPHMESAEERERRARKHFLSEHPGQQPLNVAIGKAAIELYETQPMGKFVLGLGVRDEGNDCSDFVNCVIDEGLGAKARFRRASDRHLLGSNPEYFQNLVWDHKSPLLPGDAVSVAHSPWYAPYPGACWHVGIIGADGMVYDFVKLKRWKTARYGRNGVAWFVRHATKPNEVIVTRLRPEYRYKLQEIRIPAGT